MAISGKFIIGYVLLTYGRRHTKIPLVKRPEAKRQISIIESFVNSLDDVKILWRFDYCRELRSIEDLPTLNALITSSSGKKGVHIMMDDFSRIFKICHVSDAQNLLKFFMNADVKLFDLKTGKAVSDFSKFGQGHLIYSSRKDVKRVLRKPFEGHRKNMSPAQLTSQVARGRKADHSARPIHNLKQKLEKDGAKVSLNELARQANDQGLKTTRGGEWSGKSVKRALERCAVEGAK